MANLVRLIRRVYGVQLHDNSISVAAGEALQPPRLVGLIAHGRLCLPQLADLHQGPDWAKPAVAAAMQFDRPLAVEELTMRWILLAPVALQCLVACDIPGPAVLTREGSADAQQSFIVGLGVEEVQSRLVDGWKVELQRDSEFYRAHGFRSAADPSQPTYLTRSSGVRLSCFGAGRELHLDTPMGDSVASRRYYTHSGPVRYSASFVICTTPQNDGKFSKVEVLSSNARIYNGKEFNGHALGYVATSIPVDPVAEEEQVVLRYSAHLLDVELNEQKAD